jgi:threonine dehydrogenase-like Zn-dependent dehydrogenase
MECLVWHGGRSVAIERHPLPEPGPGHVVADVIYAGICGSDLHQYRGGAGPRTPPLILGHEAVVRVPGRAGSYVVFPIVSCGGCEACGRGEQNLCEARGLIGLDRPGVFADSVAVDEAALVAIPERTDPRIAVLTEPLAASVSALRLAELAPSTRLAIVGCGPIGLLAIHAAVSAGVHPIVADPIASRRELALRLGAAEALADASALRAHAADVVLDAVGSESSWRAAITAVRSGGSVVVLGLAQADGGVPVGELVRRGIALRGHYAYTRADFEAALDLLVTRPPPLDWLDFAALADGERSFERIVDSPETVAKVILTTARADGSQPPALTTQR